jgi:hypothetical protein
MEKYNAGTKAKVKYHVFAYAQNDMQKPSYCHPDEPWRRRISLFLNTEPLYAKVSFLKGGFFVSPSFSIVYPPIPTKAGNHS